MAIVAEFTIPPDAIPGGSTLESLPDVRIELERVVPTDDAVLPYFWVFGARSEEFLEHARDEPGIVDLRTLTELPNGALFEAEWRPDEAVIEGIKQLRATIMDARATADGWEFQVRAAGRERLLGFQRVFTDQGIPVELDRIYNLAEVAETKRPLTADQQETLVVAYREGYFDEPRRATQADLAQRFDVSRRAVSNRLRRGTRNLVAATLVDSTMADDR